MDTWFNNEMVWQWWTTDRVVYLVLEGLTQTWSKLMIVGQLRLMLTVTLYYFTLKTWEAKIMLYITSQKDYKLQRQTRWPIGMIIDGQGTWWLMEMVILDNGHLAQWSMGAMVNVDHQWYLLWLKTFDYVELIFWYKQVIRT